MTYRIETKIFIVVHYHISSISWDDIHTESTIQEQHDASVQTFQQESCNVDRAIQMLFNDLPSVSRFTKCFGCNYMQHRNLPTLCINIDILFKKGFDHVQEAIDDTENLNVSQALCKKCGDNLERTHDYGPHIFLDTSVISDPNYNVEGHYTAIAYTGFLFYEYQQRKHRPGDKNVR